MCLLSALMEIRDSRSPANHVPFSNMKPGEAFTTGGNLCMRVAPKTESIANAVSLVDGRAFMFAPDDEILPVKCYIVKDS